MQSGIELAGAPRTAGMGSYGRAPAWHLPKQSGEDWLFRLKTTMVPQDTELSVKMTHPQPGTRKHMLQCCEVKDGDIGQIMQAEKGQAFTCLRSCRRA